MTTQSSQFHSEQLLLPVVLLLLVSAAANHMLMAAAAEQQHPMITHPGCRDKCGNISIPFPFGIGPGCSREGFEVSCDDSSTPPRAFLANDLANQYVCEGSASELIGDPQIMKIQVSSSLPLELVSISVATSEGRVYGGISYLRNSDDTSGLFKVHSMNLQATPFSVSGPRNVLIAVGGRAEPFLMINDRERSANGVNHFFCRSDILQEDFVGHVTNGSCTGRGCCETPFPPEDRSVTDPQMSFVVDNNTMPVIDVPCSYGMVVEKSWYNFSAPDMFGERVFAERLPGGVPLVLDFAIEDASCPAEGQEPPSDYACVSSNSSCANTATGYVCKCWNNYEGNPYISNGCQDIDECKLPERYPCSSDGICKNRPGGYECPCKFGMKGDRKEGTCTSLFPLAAKGTLGAIGVILIMAVLLFLIILRKEKRKNGEFYKKNGGPTLEKANIIKLFKKEELKPILKSKNLIGKGGFGEVYKGLLDNKLVAIKKPINGSVLENEQFANEVIIQSQVIHKNIVRLVGCCLEVDTPMLVNEFISNGSLHDILHNNKEKVALSLDTRLSIAAQSADGLAYMHSKTNIKILHGDVKPANILLDDNFVPKVSDFGISRLLARDKEHTGSVIGDMNYMDPIYLQEGLLTQKNDVYSFGVMILELISRRRAMHSDNSSLVKNFLEALKKQKKSSEFFDKEIAITEDLELLDCLAGMAMECLSLDVDQRPTMMEVAERLLILIRYREV
ncbi:hypothetical protein CFC21_005049 [Triticum aestivum]|uniref:Protein kinase domain-containing protein n=3 Tax=Triticum aestivum TaxID=4565 RepID=A0A9R1INQ1_WHEAT|nr:hypothetical protein CFC21_005049 [Triticum aestivum]